MWHYSSKQLLFSCQYEVFKCARDTFCVSCDSIWNWNCELFRLQMHRNKPTLMIALYHCRWDSQCEDRRGAGAILWLRHCLPLVLLGTWGPEIQHQHWWQWWGHRTVHLGQIQHNLWYIHQQCSGCTSGLVLLHSELRLSIDSSHLSLDSEKHSSSGSQSRIQTGWRK